MGGGGCYVVDMLVSGHKDPCHVVFPAILIAFEAEP